ncbi:MAG: ASCH domain-containing protein [Ruminococcus sp.]|nr:ASCH domain-containing protein [Ruminococcus sp.]
MKVLSLTEPYASLIKEKKKLVETRSWKTKYRGELYIHASMTKTKEIKPELLNLLEDKKLNYGSIICKCKLVDCLLMTEEYVKDMKENNYQEYICGEYSPGRYAWILEDIEVLDNPIKAKGKLSIWEYKE